MEGETQQPAKRPARPFIWAIIVALVLVLAFSIFRLIVAGGTNTALLFPDDVKSSANYSLLYPAKLPKGFKAQKTPANVSEGVVTYSIFQSDGNPLVVSEQPKPKDFDFARFNRTSIEKTQSFDTPQGSATIGKLNGINVCSLVTKTTWIMVTAQDSSGADKLTFVCKNFSALHQPAT